MANQFYDFKEVRKLRKTSGKTQQDVAEALKKDRVTIARLETGSKGSLDLLIEYTEYFNRDYRDFLLPVTKQTTNSNVCATM